MLQTLPGSLTLSLVQEALSNPAPPPPDETASPSPLAYRAVPLCPSRLLHLLPPRQEHSSPGY